jgi:hypothetical protein
MPFAAEVAKGKIKSKAQARAMFAAASGHSTLGIPKSVGMEMTAGTGHGAHKGIEKGMPGHVAHHSPGTPFKHKKGDGRPTSKKVRRGANDGGPSNFAGPNFSGTGGQGNTSTAGQYNTSSP